MDILKDYLVIIVLIVGAIVQWLKSRSGQANGNDAAHYSEEDHTQFEETQRRPAGPPPIPSGLMPGVERSPVPSLRRANTTPSFYIPENSGEIARQAALAEQIRLAKAAKAARRQITLVSPSKSAKRHDSSGTGTSLKFRLRSVSELRKAFVLKEILEKPLALR